MIEKFSADVPLPDKEYIGEDCLLHCSICHKAVQTEVEFLGRKKTVRCICDCRKKEMNAYEERKKQEERERQRMICFTETNMKSWTFENDDRRNAKLSDAMIKYSENFPEFKKDGQGVLLFGPVGTGKTYYAASIANRLIDAGHTAYMTDFTRIGNQLQGMFQGKQEFIDGLNRYSLLILDDLGVERKTEYMQEIVYNIIDSRYRSGLPFIVTTNLTADEIKKPDAVGFARIYDRILERCLPVEVSGISRRRQHLKESIVDVKSKLGL